MLKCTQEIPKGNSSTGKAGAAGGRARAAPRTCQGMEGPAAGRRQSCSWLVSEGASSTNTYKEQKSLGAVGVLPRLPRAPPLHSLAWQHRGHPGTAAGTVLPAESPAGRSSCRRLLLSSTHSWATASTGTGAASQTWQKVLCAAGPEPHTGFGAFSEKPPHRMAEFEKFTTLTVSLLKNLCLVSAWTAGHPSRPSCRVPCLGWEFQR